MTSHLDISRRQSLRDVIPVSGRRQFVFRIPRRSNASGEARHVYPHVHLSVVQALVGARRGVAMGMHELLRAISCIAKGHLR